MKYFFQKQKPKYRPVLMNNFLNYTFDLRYLKVQIRKKCMRVARVLGILLGVAAGVAVSAYLYMQFAAELDGKIDTQLAEGESSVGMTTSGAETEALLSTGNTYQSPISMASTDDAHRLLADALDDGDCTTAVVCPCCNQVLREAAAAHTPDADDGDCTTAVGCTECEVILTPACDAHTPDADDGSCMTPILCTVCQTVVTEGMPSHTPEEDDGDCLTAVKCSLCDRNAIEARADHTPMEEDGDCTTDITCTHCSYVFEEGNDAHTPHEDDGNCLTPVYCSTCGCVAISGNDAHTPMEDDGDCTTPVMCQICGMEAIEAGVHTPEQDDGDCTTSLHCSVCGTVYTEGNSAHTPEEDDGDYTTDILCVHCDTVLAKAPIDEAEYRSSLVKIAAVGVVVMLVILLLFLLLGKIVGAVRARSFERRKLAEEERNYNAFTKIRRALGEHRERLICESMASVTDEYSGTFLDATKCKQGRIFLTDRSLEFYDTDFANAYKNFLISLNTIHVVDAKEDVRENVLTIQTKSGKYEFIVPDGKAHIWKSQILYAMEREERVSYANGRYLPEGDERGL